MPVVDFTDAELRALQRLWRGDEQVDWNAYNAAKERILATTPMGRRAVRTPQHAVDRN